MNLEDYEEYGNPEISWPYTRLYNSGYREDLTDISNEADGWDFEDEALSIDFESIRSQFFNNAPEYSIEQNWFKFVNAFDKKMIEEDLEETIKTLLQNVTRASDICLGSSTLLHLALLRGTVKTVSIILKQILSEHSETDYKGLEKSEEILKVILENRAVLKICHDDYQLLIFFAAKIGDEHIFQLLLEDLKKICLENINIKMTHLLEQVDFQTFFGKKALHYAVREQLPEVVRFLLKAGANVNFKTLEGNTPLFYAVCLQNEEICQILLSSGAEVESYSKKGQLLFKVCGSKSGRLDLCGLDKNFYECYVYFFNQPVIHLNIIKLLLQYGANPNVSNNTGFTPFLYACQLGQLEIVKILFQFGANVHARDNSRNTALHVAVTGNSLEVVEFLLQKGLKVDVKNYHGETPLYATIDLGLNSLDMIEYLVDNKADLKSLNSTNVSYSLGCRSHGSMDVVECLLELGVSLKSMCMSYFIPQTKSELTFKLRRAKKYIITAVVLDANNLKECVRYIEGSIKKWPNAHQHFEKCKLEVEKLKSTKLVEGTIVSFYDFLTVGFFNAVQIAKKEGIKKMFASREYYKEFPCYSFLLEKRFERAVTLKDAVDRTEMFFRECLSPLPILVIHIILNQLSSSDFRKFSRNLYLSKNLPEQDPDPNLKYGKTLKLQILEIRENGIMVSLYPNMPPALIHNSQLDTDYDDSVEYLLNLKVGDTIRAKYLGRYPGSGQIRLAGNLRNYFNAK